LEKVACGAFSDIGLVTAGKKRGFCRLRMGQRKAQAVQLTAGKRTL
jgi:hypothetical protein